MTLILNDVLPDEMAVAPSLPGVHPLGVDDWLRTDTCYQDQMAYRRKLLRDRRNDVLFQDPSANAVAKEILQIALALLPSLGFEISGDIVFCPDGAQVDITSDTPLAILGQIVQEDICLMQKNAQEHVLVGAILCFPANWMLSEKAGKPLTSIHKTVDEYDAQLAKRVQRLFDGVQTGRPLWRNNWLKYDDPDLYQPRSIHAPTRIAKDPAKAPFIRAERQCILRLPHTNAVAFTIHSYVVRA